MESLAGESLKSVTLACRLLFKPIIEIIMAVFYSAERNVTSVAIRFKSSRRYMPLVAGVLLTVLSQIQAGAATINAASPSFADVSTAIALAANGDTVVIPSGTATWTSSLTISKAITLQGAGVGQTIIKDGLTGTTLLLSWAIPANFASRLTGIEFQNGGRTGGVIIIEFRGSNINGSTLRVDNCSFNQIQGTVNFETIIGVVDHNAFVIAPVASAIRINDTQWNDPTQLSGDKSWTAPPGYGSSQFLFIEDNTFSSSASTAPAVTDAYDGARFVLRHNSFNNCIPENHGTESHGRGRGCRVMEIYNNTWVGNGSNRFLGGHRSGSVLFHDNNVSGYWGDNAIFGMANYRVDYPWPDWGQANATSVWDVNDPTVHFTGTAASPSTASPYTVTVTGANWTTNQWVDYTIHRTTNLGNVTTVTSEGIVSNTANTITYTSRLGSAFPIPPLRFAAGDKLEIRKLVKVLDGVGVGSGSLIQGSPPTPPPGWNDQVAEPCYSWNNINELGHSVGFLPNTPGFFIKSGVHYFNNTSPPFSYTPYTYPHPLVSGAPAAPQNLHVNQ
jgi:hypothetical protein